jgi:hypothetical protein
MSYREISDSRDQDQEGSRSRPDLDEPGATLRSNSTSGGAAIRRGDTEPVDLLKLFDVATCGFLQVKLVNATKVFKFVSSPFVTYWASLDDDTLRFFANESENLLRYSHAISTSTSVKVDSIDYLDGGGTIITICVYENDVPQFYARSEDSVAMEAWVIAIIEKSRGPFADSENFDLPPQVDSHDAKDDEPKITVLAGELHYSGILRIQSESSLFIRKQFYVELKHTALSYWNSNIPDTNRNNMNASAVIQLNGYSRCYAIPSRGKDEHLFFVSTKLENGKFSSVRFLAKDRNDLNAWMEVIKLCINKIQLQHDKLLDNLASSTGSFCTTAASSLASGPATPRLYQRDETAIGKIMNKIVGDSIDDQALKKFYLETFCAPVRRNRTLENEIPSENEEKICVILYENQRYTPFKGFSVLSLLAGLDPAKLSNKDGVKFPDRYLRFSPPPSGYEWIGGSFSVDTTYTSTDKAGWTYASSFRRFHVHLAENRSLTDIRHRKALVRRRRWVRFAKRIDDPQRASVAAAATTTTTTTI